MTATSEITAIAPCVSARLPQRMRILYVTTLQRTGRWLADALAGDSAAEVELVEALGVTAALARLREEVFDVVLISHESDQLDALELIEGLRTGGSEEPMIVLGHQSDQEMTALSYEVGADGYLCVDTATTRALIWTAARAIERHELACKCRKLQQAERSRQQAEQIEGRRLLKQQRDLVDHLDPKAVAMPLPEPLVAHYREMLRAYVIMSTGDMDDEICRLVELLVEAGVTAAQAMQLHLQVLEEMVIGLGNRSCRHVMSRGDRLALEMTVHLAEGYRRQLLDYLDPPRQMPLPGFDLPDEPLW
jgi:DNA-binding response OmpR family regulator